MACCSVKWCGKNTKNSNYTKDGISFHRFPNIPELKEKWINATQRENWFPQKHNVICSKHFTSDCFDNSKKIRRLMKSAVPTQFLPILVSQNHISESTLLLENPKDTGSSYPNASLNNTADLNASNENETFSYNETEIDMPIPSHESTFPNTMPTNVQDEESKSKKSKMRSRTDRLISSLSKKNKFIKRLQAKNRHLNKIINQLKDILKTNKKCCLTKENEDLLKDIDFEIHEVKKN